MGEGSAEKGPEMTGLATDQAGGAELLLYAPVPLYLEGRTLFIEAQAANGLRLWAQHFARVRVMMPIAHGTPPKGWVAISTQADHLARVELEPLPMAYRPDQFAWTFAPTLRRIRQLIAGADYLSFAIGGLFGDWGALSCLAAHQMGRRFAVWTDRVESEVVRRLAADPDASWRSRLRGRLYHRPMATLERAVIRRADLGLFHGAETFETYSANSPNPHLVHDIHIAPEDHICAGDLANKCRNTTENAPLRIVYAGRADPMKGPFDWLRVLQTLKDRGVRFEATWLGDGPELPRMKAQVLQAGLTEQVALPGFVERRDQLLAHLRQADLFLYCHQTPESPRCLIEALISGTPIVGYGCAYAQDLISGHGGGALVPRGDATGLVEKMVALDAHRATLAQKIKRARADGAPFSDQAVFAHRSGLLKRYLGDVDGLAAHSGMARSPA